jgi:hypothetical protein
MFHSCDLVDETYLWRTNKIFYQNQSLSVLKALMMSSALQQKRYRFPLARIAWSICQKSSTKRPLCNQREGKPVDKNGRYLSSVITARDVGDVRSEETPPLLSKSSDTASASESTTKLLDPTFNWNRRISSSSVIGGRFTYREYFPIKAC